jgi:YD repeat-containing protein
MINLSMAQDVVVAGGGYKFPQVDVVSSSDASLGDPVATDDAASRAAIGSVPGEAIDPRTGTLSLTATDLVIPGNGGMDLVISRTRRNTYFNDLGATYTADRSFQESIADWRLNVPYIQMSSGSGWIIGGTPYTAFTQAPTGEIGVCAFPYTAPWWEYPNAQGGFHYLDSNFGGITIVGLPGGGEKQLLLRTEESASYLGMPYATNDRWIAGCGHSQYNGNAASQFVVSSPDGTTYYFDEPTYGNNLVYDPGAIGRPPAKGYLRIFVSRIIDRNGNEIDYHYEDSGFSGNAQSHHELRDFAYVSSITTSDGREVNFHWESNPFCALSARPNPPNCSPLADGSVLAGTGYNGAPFRRLKSFSANGRTWTFSYNDSDDSSAADKSRYLKSVTLPNGQQWSYAVTPGRTFPGTGGCGGYPFETRVTDYQVTFPTGGRVNYTMQWRWMFREGVDEDGDNSVYSCWPISAVKTRSIDDLVNSAAVTQWCYGPVPRKTGDADHRMWTYMLAPDHAEAFKYYRELTDGTRWKEDLLEELQIRAPMASCPLTPIGDSGYLRKITYEYQEGTRMSIPEDQIKRTPSYSWGLSYPRALKSRTIVQPDAGTFVQTNSNFDPYMMPQLVSEQAADGSVRRWLNRYDQRMYRLGDANTVMLGLVSKRCLVSTDTEIDCPTSPNGILQGDESSYDPAGNLLTATSYGKDRSFTYMATGDVHTVTDERRKTTTFSSYWRGKARTIVRPESAAGEQISAQINDTGTIHSITNARGYTTTYGYDLRDRLSGVDYPAGADTNIAWSADGRKKTTTRGVSVVEMSFDGMGRLTDEVARDVSTGQRIIKKRAYDAAGHLQFESYPSPTVDDAKEGLDYRYDALNRRYLTTRTVDGAYSKVTYASPEHQGVRDFNGFTTTTAWRSFGEPSYDELMSTSAHVSGYTASGGATSSTISTSFQRDSLGFATQVTQGGVTRLYSAGDKRMLVGEFVPELGSTNGTTTQSVGSSPAYNVSYCRDEAGNLLGKAIGATCGISGSISIQSIDSTCGGTEEVSSIGATESTQCSPPPGLVYVNSYDDRSRLRQTTYQGGATANVGYEYTPTDKVKKISKGPVVLEMDYDELDNLRHEIFNVDGYRFRLKYGYDDLGHLKSITYPSGKVYLLAPDAFGHAHSLTGIISNASYYSSGIIDTINYANGEATSMSLNPQNLVEDIITDGPHGSAVSLNYTYDYDGNVKTIVDGLRSNDTLAIDYDELNRQTRTRYVNAGSSFYYRGYDGVGNVLFDQTPERSLTVAYDSYNRLSSTTTGGLTKPASYDGFGNIISDGMRALTFDWAGNLVSSQAPAQKSFVYDGRDRVISRTDAQGKRYFIYSAEKLMMEYSPTENRYTEYLYFNGQLAGSRVVNSATQMDSNGNGVKDSAEFQGIGWQ